MNYKKFNNYFYDRINLFVGSSLALTLLALWAFFEASFWFIAPDFLIIFFALILPKKYKKFVFIAIIFSFFGGIFYYTLNLFFFEELSKILFNTPFVALKNINFVSNIFLNYGVAAAFLQSITLIPFKIWTHFVVEYGFNFVLYFLIVMVSRIVRFFIAGSILAFLGLKFKKFIRNNLFILILLYLFLFSLVMYLLEL